MKIYNLIMLFSAILLIIACSNSPKVIEASQPSSSGVVQGSTGIFDEDDALSNGSTTPITDGTHVVLVKEVLPTSKYVYLNVEEGNDTYWIATSKQDVNLGEQYAFTGGLLKTNFVSKEYDRTFDKVYLVSGIKPINPPVEKTKAPKEDLTKKELKVKNPTPQKVEGSISIADIINDPKKYEGSNVQVSGECTKLNANIMGKNWIHLKDGTADDYDFVITSSIAVPEGHFVTMKGDLILDKDFGSGYRYEILIENATIVQ